MFGGVKRWKMIVEKGTISCPGRFDKGESVDDVGRIEEIDVEIDWNISKRKNIVVVFVKVQHCNLISKTKLENGAKARPVIPSQQNSTDQKRQAKCNDGKKRFGSYFLQAIIPGTKPKKDHEN